MARRCLCSRLMDAIRSDPRLATLPLSIRMLFLLLGEAAARAPVPGVVPFAEPRRVSLLVSCTETEAETGLETLETEGLIRREGGGIAVPLVQEAADRASVARRNGSNGGRPRKGETREAYLARRQAAMPLPLPGGAAEKPTETEPAKPPASAVLVVEKNNTSLSTPTPGDARAPEWVSLGIEVAELAGLDGARGGFDFRPVQAWLAEGVAPETIRAAVRGVAAWSGYDARAVSSLGYFAKAVRREHAKGAPPAPRSRAEREEEAAVVARVQAGIEAHLASLSRMERRIPSVA